MHETKILIEALIANDVQRVANKFFQETGLQVVSVEKKLGKESENIFEMTVLYSDASLLVMLGRILQNLHNSLYYNNDTIMTSYND